MRPAAQQEFVAFVSQYEGVTDWMYLDVKGLVTSGIGNLLEPIALAQALPWTCSYTRAATPTEVTNGWMTVKSRQDLKLLGGGHYKSVCDLRLSKAAVADLVRKRMQDNEDQLSVWFPAYQDFCADAQMAIMSIAWAVGDNFARTFPRFRAAANAGDWLTAAAESHISDGNPARNEANRYLLTMAATSQDPELLHWPRLPDSSVG